MAQEVHHRKRLSIAVVLALLTSLLLGPSPSWAAAGVDEVHYTFTGSASVAIDWRGDANDVRWGSTTDYGQTATGHAPAWTPWSSAGPFWQTEIGGLVPGTTYHYSIGGGPDETFHAAPTGSFRFDAIGDIGDTVNFSKLAATFDSIASDDPSFVLIAGDLTYANATGSSQAAVDQHFNDVMRFSTRAAYMPAWGNHEYDVAGSDDLRNYKGRLLMPNAQASPGSPAISCCGNDWGWWDSGPVRFITYPEPWEGAWADWQTKAGLLMQQAQADPNIKYIITYGHRPAYSTGYHPGEAQIASILDGFGDTYSKYILNINGHSHDYERFQPIHGVTHVTVAAPSSLEGPWTSTDPRTAYRAMHLSHLRVDVGSTGLKLQAICDQSKTGEDITCTPGSVIDEYVIGTPPVLPAPTEFYVDKTSPTCSDAGIGTPDAPFCTITKGVSRMQAGYVLDIGNGTYAETIKPTVNGTASAPITITAWPDRNPVIGAGVTYGAYLSKRSYVTVSNLTFTGTTGDGIYVTGGDHITITGNTVTYVGQQAKGLTARGISIHGTTTASVVSNNNTNHNSDHGIYLTDTSTGITVSYNQSSFNAEGWQRNANGIDVTSPGNTVIGNVTHDNEDSGIQFFTGANNGLATLNVTYNNGDHGIDNLNVTGGRIIGNTVYRNCTSGINVEGTSGSYVVENNVATDNAVYPAYGGVACSRRTGNIGIYDSAPATTIVDHNLVYLTKSGTMYTFGTTYPSLAAMQAATRQEKAGVQADPKFVSTAANNLQLGEGSVAIDRADSGLAGEQATDILGNPRVRDPNVGNTFAAGPRLYDDLGAYEFQPTSAAQAPAAALSATPTTGQAPVQATANASGSTDPQGQTLSYAYNFGDGTTLPAQPGATATHTYTTAGTFTITVTVTNTFGLSSTASTSITTTNAPQPPTARLSASPTTGTTPLAVTANASTSTDPQGQTLSYAYNFGDGTTLPAQPGATATHTFTTAGTFTISTTVTNTSGLSSTANTTITTTNPPPTNPPAYVSQIASNSSTATKTTGYITVWRPAGVQAGSLLVLTLQLSKTAPTGPVSATDDRANTYTLASSTANTTGGRLVVLSGIATQPLAAGAKITATFPAATGYRMLGDEFTGAQRVDTTTSATGTTGTFSSGPTTTTAAGEVIYGTVAIFGGTANPTWATGWTDMTSYVVAPNYLGRAYQLPTAIGTFAATGTATGSWLATTVTFAP